ncbi:MAG: hypothetical protein NT076_01690 [Candidatus Pacearchaeota archaeon]|nr:hypothetical protein [Candidatus Pacearchaeota archaeon]
MTEENKPQIGQVEQEKKPVETPIKEVKKEQVKEAKKQVEKKEFAQAQGRDMPLSLKHVKFICRFIKGKTIQEALDLMNKVSEKKIYVPMSGELACRKKGIKGRYPVKASREFIRVLKGLQGNANVAGLLNPIITETVSNKASQPHKKGGLRFKRTHVLLKVTEKQEKPKKENKPKEKK